MFKIPCETVDDGRRVHGEMLSSLTTKYYEEYRAECKLLSMDYGIAAHTPKIDKELGRFKVRTDNILSASHIRCQVHGFSLMLVTRSRNGKSMPWGRRFSIDSMVYVDIPDDLWTLEFMLARGGVSV